MINAGIIRYDAFCPSLDSVDFQLAVITYSFTGAGNCSSNKLSEKTLSFRTLHIRRDTALHPPPLPPQRSLFMLINRGILETSEPFKYHPRLNKIILPPSSRTFCRLECEISPSFDWLWIFSIDWFLITNKIVQLLGRNKRIKMIIIVSKKHSPLPPPLSPYPSTH